MKDIQLLFIGNFLLSKGISSISYEVATRLKLKGYVVFTTSKYVNRFLRFFDMVFKTFALAGTTTFVLIDVFSGTAFYWAETIGKILTLLGRPYILILHGGNLPEFSEQKSERVYKLFKNASAVITPSRYLLGSMKKYYADIQLIPNPVELSEYSSFFRKEASARIVWLRSFHAIYNPCLAIQVIRLLALEFPHTKLIMVGPDKQDGSFQETKKLTEDLGLSKFVEFPGGIGKADVPLWLNKGDIFINTTNIDNTPVSVIEAMASGLCIVSTNVGGIPYLLDDEVNALLVPPNDAEAMAFAVKRILTESGLAARLSQNARKKAEQFDWKNISPMWETLFTSLVKDSR